MEIATRDYGVVTIDASSVVHFEEGLPGFEAYHDYALFNDDGNSPFCCLQSTENSALAFILLDPFVIKPDYNIVLDDNLLAQLGIRDSADVTILAIVVVPEDITKMSVNLKAPLVINARLRRGAQYIADDSPYKIRHYISEIFEPQD